VRSSRGNVERRIGIVHGSAARPARPIVPSRGTVSSKAEALVCNQPCFALDAWHTAVCYAASSRTSRAKRCGMRRMVGGSASSLSGAVREQQRRRTLMIRLYRWRLGTNPQFGVVGISASLAAAISRKRLPVSRARPELLTEQVTTRVVAANPHSRLNTTQRGKGARFAIVARLIRLVLRSRNGSLARATIPGQSVGRVAFGRREIRKSKRSPPSHPGREDMAAITSSTLIGFIPRSASFSLPENAENVFVPCKPRVHAAYLHHAPWTF
jgi:hypothetical protein